MRPRFYPSTRPAARRGVALVIVLAFILLVTGLILAFFSRALNERQISNSSVTQVKTDLLAQGATDVLIGDLQQEIAAGSTAYPLTTPPAQGSRTLFLPGINAQSGNVPKNFYTMVPATVLPSPTPANPSTVTGLESLVKQSVGGANFYPATGYDNVNYPPSARAAKSSATLITSADGTYGDNSTDTPSQNGRYISRARWNKPLLLPPSKADNTPSLANSATFVPPDWVLVTRDGSNGNPAAPGIGPTTGWNTASKAYVASSTSATAVVGRYAYNVYDEGGLLDANLAGYSLMATGPTPSTPNLGPYGVYKNALSYADLTQLTDTTGATGMLGAQLLSAPQIEALMGWRNGASAQAPGAFPSPAFTDASRTNYYNSILINPSGFLSMSNVPLGGGTSKQSDRMFGDRQTLIALMQSIASLTGGDALKTNTALRFLTSFSRDLNQPSFTKTYYDVNNPGLPGYDTTAPKVLDLQAGGNNAGTDISGKSGPVVTQGLDEFINPTFLNVRVKTTVKANLAANPPVGRFDGSDLVAGEPLVKKRFALNRLAWLTYLGPSANNMNSAIVQATIKAMGGTASPGDPVYQFVAQGTAANIQNYFGLVWETDPRLQPGVLSTYETKSSLWVYTGHNRNFTNGAIRKLSYAAESPAGADVLGANREADFFELLKAAINVGSIAKTATPPPTNFNSTDPTNPAIVINTAYAVQYKNDYRVDDAIIQIGANIIDQFDLDSYPTRIVFDDGNSGTSGGRLFCGDEDLPYLSGIKHALVKVKQAEGYPNTPPACTNTGVGALLQCPELWNPHDYNPAAQLPPLSANFIPPPTQFRIWAESDPIFLISVGTTGHQSNGVSGGYSPPTGGQAASKGWGPDLYGFPWTPPQVVLSQPNTMMTFTSSSTPCREPTILFQPTSVTSFPAASFANYGQIASITPQYPNEPLFFTSNGAFKSAVDSGVTNAPPLTGNVPPAVGQGYIGFYLGAVPLYFDYFGTGNSNSLAPAHRVALLSQSNQAGFAFHYYLQYQDSSKNWVTYDQKNQLWGATSVNPYQYSAENSGLTSGGAEVPDTTSEWRGFLYSTCAYDTGSEYIDPRTSRFMNVRTWNADLGVSPTQQYWSYPPFAATSTGWLNATPGITVSMRDGTGSGVAIPTLSTANFFPSTIGWYPGNWSGGNGENSITTASLYHTMFRPALISQNNPLAYGDGVASARYSAATVPSSTEPAVPEYYADPDGVVRRAMAGLVPTGGSSGPAASFGAVGLPMQVASTNNGSTRNVTQSISRPIVLNRPFHSVADLGCTFSGTPWKTLNFNMPESGDSALLDVFCVGDTDDLNGRVAGKVNLNTRQVPVLQAIVAGAYKDEFDAGNSTIAAGSGSVAALVAKALVTRTANRSTAGTGPLRNVAELVGRWGSTKLSALPVGGIDPKSYVGFSADIWNGSGMPATVLAANAGADANISRYETAAIRALANCGQTRVWNLMFDVVAQAGRYPPSATGFNNFVVEGEQRYWVHVAIDRYTGNVIDKQIEVVKE